MSEIEYRYIDTGSDSIDIRTLTPDDSGNMFSSATDKQIRELIIMCVKMGLDIDGDTLSVGDDKYYINFNEGVIRKVESYNVDINATFSTNR